MVKKRFNKTGTTGSTEFIGFSAFATPTSAPTTASSSDENKNNNSNHKNASSLTTVFIPSPIYITTLNNDNNNNSTIISKVQTIFKKILKKDVTTKCRALQQLRDNEIIHNIPKKEIVAISSYLFYIFETKLFIDNSRNVRYEILKTFVFIQELIPKAFFGFLSCNYKLIGMIYCMSCDYSTSEVKNEAVVILKEYDMAVLQENIMEFITFVLKNIHRPSHIPLLTSVTTSSQPQASTATTGETDKEEMEERYERIVLSTLHALSQLLSTNNNISFDISILKKQLSNSRSYFRKATYQIFICIIQHNNNLCSTTTTQQKLVDMLYYALDNEKTQDNIIISLQWLLLTLKNFHKETTINENKLHTQLCKLFTKGCYYKNNTADVNEWTCMILPIIALLYPNTAQKGQIISSKNEDVTMNNLQSILSLLDALEKGKQSFTNDNNKAYISSCITEIVYYMLKQSIMKHTVSSAFTTKLNTLLEKYEIHFINSFQFFLTSRNNNKELCITLSREINKLCILSLSSENNKSVLFHYIQLSLWNNITISIVSDSSTSTSQKQLCKLLKYLRKDTIQYQLLPCLTTLAHDIINTNNNLCAKSPSIPKYESIELLYSILNVTIPISTTNTIIPDVKRFFNE